MCEIELWLTRQKNKIRIYGVETATFKHSPGNSNRHYISNLETLKRMSRENLAVLKLMSKLNLP